MPTVHRWLDKISSRSVLGLSTFTFFRWLTTNKITRFCIFSITMKPVFRLCVAVAMILTHLDGCTSWMGVDLASHLASGAPIRFVPVGFEMDTIFAGLLSGILAICPDPHVLPDLAAWIILHLSNRHFKLLLVLLNHTPSNWSILLNTRRSKTCWSSACIVQVYCPHDTIGAFGFNGFCCNSPLLGNLNERALPLHRFHPHR